MNSGALFAHSAAFVGQERRILDGSRHVASTVEMANLSQRAHVNPQALHL